MREILFRMYDGVKMVYDGLVIYNGELYEDWRAFEDGIKSDNPLMQYTGLDDKNGVKIFEGDVVRYLNSIESGNGVVIFDTCAFLFNWIDIDETDSLLRYFQCSEELEVIGNVHDNPEVTE